MTNRRLSSTAFSLNRPSSPANDSSLTIHSGNCHTKTKRMVLLCYTRPWSQAPLRTIPCASLNLALHKCSIARQKARDRIGPLVARIQAEASVAISTFVRLIFGIQSAWCGHRYLLFTHPLTSHDYIETYRFRVGAEDFSYLQKVSDPVYLEFDSAIQHI